MQFLIYTFIFFNQSEQDIFRTHAILLLLLFRALGLDDNLGEYTLFLFQFFKVPNTRLIHNANKIWPATLLMQKLLGKYNNFGSPFCAYSNLMSLSCRKI